MSEETPVKRCTKCGEDKPATSEFFPRSNKGRNGLHSQCKSCCNAYHKEHYIKFETPERKRLKALNRKERRSRPEVRAREDKQLRNRALIRKYGITQEDYDILKSIQEGRCAICDRVPDNSHCGMLVVDHDHKTNKLRQLLCASCNKAIGILKDDPVLLRAAADYIDKHTGRNL